MELFLKEEVDTRYRFEVDASRRFLKITLRGSWEVEAVERYGASLAAAKAKLASADWGSKEARILIDVSELQIRQEDVAEHYRKLAVHKAHPSGKLAMVLASGLLKLQMKKMGPGRQRFFESEDAAIAMAYVAITRPASPPNLTARHRRQIFKRQRNSGPAYLVAPDGRLRASEFQSVLTGKRT